MERLLVVIHRFFNIISLFAFFGKVLDELRFFIVHLDEPLPNGQLFLLLVAVLIAISQCTEGLLVFAEFQYTLTEILNDLPLSVI